MSKTISTFLGANTPCGFVSFFDDIYNPYENSRAFIIKGGPGTGKSVLMKKVAEAAKEKGLFTEYIYCSSDPQSLDGVIIPELGLAFADGTSPHVLEPKFPGACENIINTGEFWNGPALFSKRDEIRSLTLENSLHHRRSSSYLSAAGKLADENRRIVSNYVNIEKIYSYALRFAARELPKIKAYPGKKMRRFISAISPEGNIFFADTVKALASRVIGVEDEYSAVSSVLIDHIGELAVKKGYDVVFCYCPMKPKGECEHIIIPEAGIALISERKSHSTALEYDRIIHSARFLSGNLSLQKKRLIFNGKLKNELLAESISCLKSAKKVHDDLENFYIETMDFKALGEYTQKIINETVRC